MTFLNEEELDIIMDFADNGVNPSFGAFCFNTEDKKYPTIFKSVSLSDDECEKHYNNFWNKILNEKNYTSEIIEAGKNLSKIFLEVKNLQKKLNLEKVAEDNANLRSTLVEHRKAFYIFQTLLKEKEREYFAEQNISYEKIIHFMTRQELSQNIDALTGNNVFYISIK